MAWCPGSYTGVLKRTWDMSMQVGEFWPILESFLMQVTVGGGRCQEEHWWQWLCDSLQHNCYCKSGNSQWPNTSLVYNCRMYQTQLINWTGRKVALTSGSCGISLIQVRIPSHCAQDHITVWPWRERSFYSADRNLIVSGVHSDTWRPHKVQKPCINQQIGVLCNPKQSNEQPPASTSCCRRKRSITFSTLLCPVPT